MTIKLDGTAAEVLNADPLVIKNQKSHFHIHSYGGWSKFFVGLREGKLLATRCTNAECDEKSLWLPPRCECADCWHATEWVEAPTVGKIYTHSTVLYPGAPFRASTPCCSRAKPQFRAVCPPKPRKILSGLSFRMIFSTK